MNRSAQMPLHTEMRLSLNRKRWKWAVVRMGDDTVQIKCAQLHTTRASLVGVIRTNACQNNTSVI